MQTTSLNILPYRARILVRWLRQRAFVLFVLTPILLGAVLLSGGRLLSSAREGLRMALEGSVGGVDGVILAGLAAALVATALALPGTLRELYGEDGLAQLFDASSLPSSQRLVVCFAAILVRGLAWAPLWVLVGVALADGDWLTPWPGALAFTAAVAALQLPVALGVAHFRFWSPLHAVGMLTVVAACLALPPVRVLLAPWWIAGAPLSGLLQRSLNLPALDAGPAASPIAWIVLLGACWALALWAYPRWWRGDLSAVRRQLTAAGEVSVSPPPRSAVAALVRRDLRMVRRRFSVAVPTALGIALTLDVVVLLLLLDARLPELWLRRLAVLGGTFSVTAVVSLVPFLVRHQLRRLWIERSTGLNETALGLAKVQTAFLLAIPAFLCAAVPLAFLPGHSPREILIAVLQLLSTTVVAASFVGIVVYEVAEEPLLGWLLGVSVAMAVGSLLIFYPNGWWLWLALYGYGASQAAGRVGRRVQLTEIPR